MVNYMCSHTHCDILQVWPEVTDPEKFVYEDVAIATYLLVSVSSAHAVNASHSADTRHHVAVEEQSTRTLLLLLTLLLIVVYNKM